MVERDLQERTWDELVELYPHKMIEKLRELAAKRDRARDAWYTNILDRLAIRYVLSPFTHPEREKSG